MRFQSANKSKKAKKAYKECIKALPAGSFWHSQITANTRRTSGERQTKRMCRPLPLCAGIYAHTRTYLYILLCVQVCIWYFALRCKARRVAAFSPLIAGICLRYALGSTKYIILHSCKSLRMHILQLQLMQAAKQTRTKVRVRAWRSNEEEYVDANAEAFVSRRESTQLFVFCN